MLLKALDLELSFERGLAGAFGEVDWSRLVAAEVADPLCEAAERAGPERQPHEPELVVEILEGGRDRLLDGPDLDRDAGHDEQVADVLVLSPLRPVIDRAGRHLGQCRGLDRPIWIALDCAERGVPIRANMVHPGAIRTPMYNRYKFSGADTPENIETNFAATHPMNRIGEPEEVARAVVFLASPRASFISGTNLVVDGTLTMRVPG